MAEHQTARFHWPRVVLWVLVVIGGYVAISWIFRIASFLLNVIFFGFLIAILIGIVAVIRSLGRDDR